MTENLHWPTTQCSTFGLCSAAAASAAAILFLYFCLHAAGV